MAVRQRGLKDIRTLSGSGDGIAQPHKVHLKIACLELERLRRGKEHEAARKRVEDIDQRMEDIDAEEKALLELLPCAEGEEGGSRPAEAPSSSPRGKRGRKFRY